MYWNNSCKNLSRLLHKDFPHHAPDMKKSFNCSNPNINFDYYYCDEDIDPKIVFNDIVPEDNTESKNKLGDRLMNKELTRFNKESSKDDFNDEHFEKCLTKHFDFFNKMEDKVSNLDGFVRSKRFQILPTKYQKNTLHNWFRDCVSVYNRLVSHFTQIYAKYQKIANTMDIPDNERGSQLAKLLKSNKEFPLNFQQLRELKIKEYCEDYYKVPYCVIADVIKEFITNIKSNVTKMSKYNINDFVFKHKKYNRMHHSITIESHYTTETGFYPSILGSIKVNDNKFQWENVVHDYKLIYNKYSKQYYIHVPAYVFGKEQNDDRNPIAIMDPGERKFQTLYGLTHIIKIGENIGDPIRKRLLKIDSLKKKIDHPRSHKYNKKLKRRTRVRKWRYNRRIQKHHEKINHLQQELHYKTAIYLCRNYDRIMVTDFSSKKVGSKKGNLNKMSKRVLGKISHYNFRQRLQNKCQEYGCQYLEVNEAYTSKTCCKCGNVKHTLGTNKIYKCDECKIVLDRDVNGAIGIFLKNHTLV